MANGENNQIYSSTRRSAGEILNESIHQGNDNVSMAWASAVSEEIKMLFAEINKANIEISTILQTVNNVSTKLDKFINDQLEKDKLMEQRLTKVEETLQRVDRENESNFQAIVSTKNNLFQEIKENDEMIREEIALLKSNSLNKTSLSESIIEMAKTPDFKCPTFDETYRFRPMKFLKDLKAFIQASHTSSTQLTYILSQSMNGMHSAWYDMASRHIKSFYDFEKLFKEKFWNEETRRNVARDLEFGKYMKGDRSNRCQYAIRKINAAYDLEENLDEANLIHTLSRHFDKDLKLIIRVQKISKITDFVNLLASLDNEDNSETRYKQKNYNEKEVHQVSLHKEKPSFAKYSNKGNMQHDTSRQKTKVAREQFIERCYKDVDPLELGIVKGNE